MKKRWRILSFILILAVAVSVFALQMRADLGGFSGDSDYGGSSDSGWGGSSYDSDSSSSYGIVGDVDPFFTVIVVVVVIGIVIFANSRLGRNRVGTNAPGATGVNRAQLRPMSEYLSVDTLFNEAAFKEKLSNMYVQMQNCAQSKDMAPLRPYLTDALYAQFDRQLEELRKLGRTNMVERIAVLDVNLLGFNQDGTNDTIYARINTRIVDYTVDKDGNVVSGSKTAEKFMEYEWALIRKTGVTTASASAEKVINCPNCGAPMNVNQSAKCEFCDSVLTTTEYDWVLSSVKGISQRTA